MIWDNLNAKEKNTSDAERSILGLEKARFVTQFVTSRLPSKNRLTRRWSQRRDLSRRVLPKELRMKPQKVNRNLARGAPDPGVAHL